MIAPPISLASLWFAVAIVFAFSRRPRRLSRPLPSRATQRPRSHRRVRWRDTLASLPVLSIRTKAKQTARSARELADVIDLFALAVASGLNLRLALFAVASRAPPSWVEQLSVVVGRIDRGSTVADALDGLPGLTGPHAHPLVSVLVSSERYGTALLPALERLAIEARFERRRRAEEAARRIPVKLLFPLVLCILPAFGALTVAPLIAGALRTLRLS
jgi:tight adherence protein C